MENLSQNPKSFFETNKMVFLVTFNGVSNKFITDIEGLGDTVKNNNRHGIDSIKSFNAPKAKFERISKESIAQWVNYNTHTYQELKKANFFR